MKKYWNGDLISIKDRVQIKANIVDLMISTPVKVQSQLSDIVSTIADTDFPANWEGLIKVSPESLPDFYG